MPRQRYDRQALRCVYQILETLKLTRQAVLQDHARWVEQVLEQLPPISRTAHQLTQAVSLVRDSTASSMIAQRLKHQLHTTSRDMQVLNSQLSNEACPPTPSLRDLLGELDQLENEFGGWHYDGRIKELSVITDPIRLRGVELGPFRICLRLGQPIAHLIGRLCAVQAIEPNTAASNDEVTHPHISGEGICVGDFGPDLLRSLRGGRVCDFFLMIRSILNTYNPDSPYVSLDEWYGEPCGDCGRSVTEEDRYGCEACERSVCDDCISACPHCHASICYGCVTMCRKCEKSSCAECLAPCIDCGDLVCPECVEDDLCPTCLENRDDEDDQDEQEEDNEKQSTAQEEQAAQ